MSERNEEGREGERLMTPGGEGEGRGREISGEGVS